MKTKTPILLLISALASCTPTASWSKFQPLDTPGYVAPTVAELHRENICEITGRPYFPRQ